MRLLPLIIFGLICVLSGKRNIMKTMVKNIAAYLILAILMGCGASNKIVEPSAQSKALDEMVSSKQFKFDAEWARPIATSSLNSIVNSGMLPPGNNAGQINIMGNGSYFKMEGDSVSADLPYFGERQMGGGYDSDTGIKFEGVPDDLKIVKDETKQRYDIRFKIKKKSEVYQVQLEVYPNLNGNLSINSSQRFTIRYDGKVSDIENSEPK